MGQGRDVVTMSAITPLFAMLGKLVLALSVAMLISACSSQPETTFDSSQGLNKCYAVADAATGSGGHQAQQLYSRCAESNSRAKARNAPWSSLATDIVFHFVAKLFRDEP